MIEIEIQVSKLGSLSIKCSILTLNFQVLFNCCKAILILFEQMTEIYFHIFRHIAYQGNVLDIAGSSGLWISGNDSG